MPDHDDQPPHHQRSNPTDPENDLARVVDDANAGRTLFNTEAVTGPQGGMWLGSDNPTITPIAAPDHWPAGGYVYNEACACYLCASHPLRTGDERWGSEQHELPFSSAHRLPPGRET